MEEWRDVVTNPNYIVSNDGRIRRRGCDKDHSTRMKKGYLITDLYENGKRTTSRVHRLVAEAYVENPDNKPEVNHKDLNKLNNNASNLEWMTKSENIRHAYDNGIHANRKPSYGMLGKKNPNAGRKGKPFKIVETGEVFNTLLECEKAINGNDTCIQDCLKGRQKTHRGYHFEYV